MNILSHIPALVGTALGVFTHEAVTVDTDRWHLYLTEDLPDGRLYRFVPERMTALGYPDLSSGTLEVAVVVKLPPTDYSQPAMECEARFSDSKAIAAKDKIVPWLEKLCAMKIK